MSLRDVLTRAEEAEQMWHRIPSEISHEDARRVFDEWREAMADYWDSVSPSRVRELVDALTYAHERLKHGSPYAAEERLRQVLSRLGSGERE